MNYEQACIFLESLQKLDSPLEYMKERKAEDLEKYLLRMQELLNRLGNPESDMKCIHVTGTAGKGTTTAMIHNMLHLSGHRVGSVSSPATTTTIERIQVNGLYIDPDIFSQIVVDMKPIILDMYMNSVYGKPSYFDIMLAIALVYFKQQQCEWVVLEVGMGGRYDSTNIIRDVHASLITNISFDHTNILGNSLQEIGYEKAGIIKENSLFFTTEQNPEVLSMFEKICSEKNTQYNLVPVVGNPNKDLVRALGVSLQLSEKYIDTALQDTQLPCRFEHMHAEPTVILDGAHNTSKVAYSLKKLESISYENLFVMFGCLNSKDAFGMIDQVVQYTKHITLGFSSSFQRKSFSLKKMHKYILERYPDVFVNVALDAEQSLQQLIGRSGPNDCVLVIGSLYLAGDMRIKWYPEDFVLEKRTSF